MPWVVLMGFVFMVLWVEEERLRGGEERQIKRERK